ncbi:hypothetical protein APX70_05028 [Pseudomonas syringae pv. maculicola]|uniref:Uncharacterized protein n=1 Tax=Pseudomonas syringae pv. maculicola TaxID=59511 RepID=A0A3M2ZRZ2_PSEYM|nr:hypothetical protein APX70_05028 [Pseudomonas syringae pv. maculicola]
MKRIAILICPSGANFYLLKSVVVLTQATRKASRKFLILRALAKDVFYSCLLALHWINCAGES